MPAELAHQGTEATREERGPAEGVACRHLAGWTHGGAPGRGGSSRRGGVSGREAFDRSGAGRRALRGGEREVGVAIGSGRKWS